MRPLAIAAALLLATPALAQAPRGQAARPAPARMGEFQSWTAATHQENGQKVCYAFARARAAEGVPNREAGNVMLLVTHRPGGRDQVAARVSYPYGRGAEPKLTVGGTELLFYTSGDTAFARDGRAVVAALRNGSEARLRGPGPNGRGAANDAFPLAGFAQAYEAISRECPAAAPPRR
jgi:invasion protein IalB